MNERLKSRKLIIAALTGLLLTFNRKLGLDLDTPTVLAIAGVMGGYVVSQGWVDGQKGKEAKPDA